MYQQARQDDVPPSFHPRPRGRSVLRKKCFDLQTGASEEKISKKVDSFNFICYYTIVQFLKHCESLHFSTRQLRLIDFMFRKEKMVLPGPGFAITYIVYYFFFFKYIICIIEVCAQHKVGLK